MLRILHPWLELPSQSRGYTLPRYVTGAFSPRPQAEQHGDPHGGRPYTEFRKGEAALKLACWSDPKTTKKPETIGNVIVGAQRA